MCTLGIQMFAESAELYPQVVNVVFPNRCCQSNTSAVVVPYDMSWCIVANQNSKLNLSSSKDLLHSFVDTINETFGQFFFKELQLNQKYKFFHAVCTGEHVPLLSLSSQAQQFFLIRHHFQCYFHNHLGFLHILVFLPTQIKEKIEYEIQHLTYTLHVNILHVGSVNKPR